jgi:hypothetical protein
MKSAALTESLLLFILLTTAMPANADARDCASPPGPQGTIRCESDQMAICEATGSRVIGQCLDKRGRTDKQMVALLLSGLYERGVTADELEKGAHAEVLRDKQFTRSDGTVVTFSYDEERGIVHPSATDHFDKPSSLTCTACVTTMTDERICGSGTAATREEATRAATEALQKKVSARFGFGVASELGEPNIECK